MRLPLLLGLAATLLLGGVWLLVTAQRDSSALSVDAASAVLSPADRDALAAEPVDPGPAPDAPDPSVDLADPVAVARAYVGAAYSLRDTDAGHTNRRAIRYAAPSTPPNTVGVLVVSPPPSGHEVIATVTTVTQVGGEPSDTRRGYLVCYRTTELPDSAEPTGRLTRYLLLVRQFDDRWLVAGDTADAQFGEQ
jgi:hypothetical protein